MSSLRTSSSCMSAGYSSRSSISAARGAICSSESRKTSDTTSSYRFPLDLKHALRSVRMRGPMRLDEFAEFVGMSTDEVERIRDAGLLDLDRDGLFDQMDHLRLHYVHVESDRGRSIDEIAAAVKGGPIDF